MSLDYVPPQFKCYRRLTCRGWNYYAAKNFFEDEPIARSVYELWREESKALRRKWRLERDKLRHS